MHLVDEPVTRRIEKRFAGKKSLKQERAAGTVDARCAHDNSASGEHQLLRFAENPCSRPGRLRRAFLGHPSAVALRINAGTAGKNQARVGKGAQEIPGTAKVDPAVIFLSAATGTDALNDNVEIVVGGCHVRCLTDVASATRIRRLGQLGGW